MLVRCVRSFAGRDAKGNRISYGMGDEFELPEGVDWLNAGLVVPVVVRDVDLAERAVVEPKEKRVSRRDTESVSRAKK